MKSFSKILTSGFKVESKLKYGRGELNQKKRFWLNLNTYIASFFFSDSRRRLSASNN